MCRTQFCATQNCVMQPPINTLLDGFDAGAHSIELRTADQIAF